MPHEAVQLIVALLPIGFKCDEPVLQPGKWTLNSCTHLSRSSIVRFLLLGQPLHSPSSCLFLSPLHWLALKWGMNDDILKISSQWLEDSWDSLVDRLAPCWLCFEVKLWMMYGRAFRYDVRARSTNRQFVMLVAVLTCFVLVLFELLRNFFGCLRHEEYISLFFRELVRTLYFLCHFCSTTQRTQVGMMCSLRWFVFFFFYSPNLFHNFIFFKLFVIPRNNPV